MIKDEGIHISERQDVREFMHTTDTLLGFLVAKDVDPEQGDWRSQLRQLATQMVKQAAALRQAGLYVTYQGSGRVEVSADIE